MRNTANVCKIILPLLGSRKATTPVAGLLLLSFAGTALAQGTVFSYQGLLSSGNAAANGSYDLTFALFNASSAGSQAGTTITNTGVAVTDGLFTVTLDFGNQFKGVPYWLAIGVRTNGGGSFTALSPRQQLLPMPYAIMANSASNLLGTLPAGQLSGALGNSQLANNSITVSAGTGLSGGGAVSLGGSTSLAASLNRDPTLLGNGGSSSLGLNLSNANTWTAPQTFSSTIIGSISGSAAKVANGVYTTGSYADPAWITSLAGTKIAGTLADAHLSSNVGLLNANQIFSGSNRFSGVVQLTNTANTIAGTFSGSGGGLTNLNSSHLASGTVPSDRLSGTYAGALTFSNASNTLAGNGSALTALNASNLASGTVPGARLSGTYSNVVSFMNATNSFGGDGSGLIKLNASALASGIVPSGRLSGTYSNAVVFNNASNSFTGSFSGNGAGLTNLNAGSLASGTVPSGRLSGTYSNAVSFTNASNSFSGNGSGLTNAGLAQTTVLNVNYSGSAVSYSTTYTKVADIGTFTKLLANSTIEVAFNGRTYVSAMSFGSPGAIFELRVDGAATSHGRARASYRSSESGTGAGIQTSITGIFTGLAATTHTVSMWIQAVGAGASGTGAQLDPGSWSTDHVVVKELK
jgi:hypothetical protein